MPTYDYEHTGSVNCDLGPVFEQFQSISSDPLKLCPTCGADIRRRISSGAGIIFKGSGFYCTDFKNTKPEPTLPPTTNHKPADPLTATETKTYKKD